MRSQTYHQPRKRKLAVSVISSATLAALWLRLRPFAVAVEGRSMEPTLHVGDYLLAVRPARLGRGSLVVFGHPRDPGFELVKRVAGLSGDAVEGRRVGFDEIWVVGDRAGGSTDSSSFGPIRRSALKGRVVLRYWPLGRMRLFRRVAPRPTGDPRSRGPSQAGRPDP